MIIREMKSIIDRYEKRIGAISRFHPKWFKYIIENTKSLNKYSDVSFAERAYCFRNDIKDRPVCKLSECSNRVNFYKFYLGYSEHCCRKCMARNELTISKRKKTCLKKYGVSNPAKSEKVKKKIKTIFLKKYGVEHVLQNKEIKAKAVKTCIQNGSQNYSKISQKLFWLLYNDMNECDKEKIYFGELNKEFGRKINNHSYFFDFVDSKRKKIIEFNGDIFHANPSLYNENDRPNPYDKSLTAKEIWENDKFKKNEIEKQGFEIFYVWENDFRNNPLHTIRKCKKFLLSNDSAKNQGEK